MANAIWQATIVDQSGNVLPGAEVEVVNESTGLSAPLFTTRTGTTKSNPFFADANGFAQFYAAPGLYRITATSSGTGTTMTWRNVRLIDVATNAEAIAGTAGVLPDAAGVHAAFKQYGLGVSNLPLYVAGTLDTLSETRFWHVNSNQAIADNFPGGTGGELFVIGGVGNGIYAKQFYFPVTDNLNRFYTRTRDSGVWSSWVEMYHTGNSVGTVSQSGGVPTGAIIQRGSNANGEYVRFADGTQICRVIFGLSATNTDSFVVGSATYYRIRDLWTFPIPFLTTTSLTVLSEVNQNSDNIFVSTKNRGLTVSGVSIDSLSTASFSAFARSATYAMAIGRWY